MKDILITGAHGFVGSNLASALTSEQGLLVEALDVVDKRNPAYVKYYNWNQLNEIDNNELYTIIHLAGKAHDTKNTSEGKEYFDINLGLTKIIIEFFIQSNAKKFIFFSSVKAVADTVKGVQLTEEEDPNPQTPYGRSKLEAERYILSQQLPADKKVYILRPCMIHGPGNKGNLNMLFKVVKKRIPWPLGAFDNKRSFASIDNLSFIIKKFIEMDIESGIYQVADDEPVSTNKLIQLIAESHKKKPHILKFPQGLIWFIARVGTLFHLPLNNERLKKLTESYVVSNEKIKKALNIKQMPFSTEDGLLKTIKSFN